jgi:hypothetical protein
MYVENSKRYIWTVREEEVNKYENDLLGKLKETYQIYRRTCSSFLDGRSPLHCLNKIFIHNHKLRLKPID